MFNPRLWCDTNLGTFYQGSTSLEYDCVFIPATIKTTINDKLYDYTDKNYNLIGWLPPRIMSNYNIGRDILEGDVVYDINKFNLVQTQFCDIKPVGKCETDSDCLNVNNSSYCYQNSCFISDFPVSIISQKNVNKYSYGNISIPIAQSYNITSMIYNFTNYFFNNGSDTDGSIIKCF
jgi:hypothetical protein